MTTPDGGQPSEEKARLRLQLAAIGVPAVTQRAFLGERALMDTTAMLAVRRFLVEMGARPWLLLAGGTGVGKSTAAAFAAVALHQATGPGSALWVNSIELSGLDRWSSRVKGLGGARALLVLDDLDSFATSRAEQVVLPRADALRPLVMTTGLTLDAFERAHPRVFDRLRELGSVVEVHGPSMRGASDASEAPP